MKFSLLSQRDIDLYPTHYKSALASFILPYLHGYGFSLRKTFSVASREPYRLTRFCQQHTDGLGSIFQPGESQVTQALNHYLTIPLAILAQAFQFLWLVTPHDF